ncbi:MAG: arginine--tRNA ligase [Acidiferrobacteraceae bacterium]|nr:arginine--tRNA ligase [Acidiferrobacteraceae bacterium]
MLEEIRSLLQQSIKSLRESGKLDHIESFIFTVDYTREKERGDVASNIALVLANAARSNPRELAENIIQHLPFSPFIDRTEAAGPGFINFFFTREVWTRVIEEIRNSKQDYGKSKIGAGQKVLVEFVSSNPTGPLHVGHGRGAAYGDALVRVLQAAGYDAQSEYYINDAGRQIDILALSIWIRYLELCGDSIAFPEGLYLGDYIFDIAAQLRREDGNAHYQVSSDLFESLPGDIDEKIDTLIKNMKSILSEGSFSRIRMLGSSILVTDIKKDLTEFGVEFDRWYSEKSLIDSGALDRMVGVLQGAGQLYKKDGAQWFRSTAFGDDKDRVLIRANGNYTYFATDVAYHMDKLDRGFSKLINIWGADHHGYIARVKAAIAALGKDPDQLAVALVQFAVLYQGGEKIGMSTRSGAFVTLQELRHKVGRDAGRFLYVLRKPEQHMDFDLDLAVKQSKDNPVYYVQYAHARICSVFQQLQERDMNINLHSADADLLTEIQELELLRSLARYPEVVAQSARNYEPHQVAYYIKDLATDFHAYYNAHPFIAVKGPLRLARLLLIDATRQVLANGLKLLGVAAPERM